MKAAFKSYRRTSQAVAKRHRLQPSHCQCVVHEVDADGVEKIQIGELVLPKIIPLLFPHV